MGWLRGGRTGACSLLSSVRFAVAPHSSTCSRGAGCCGTCCRFGGLCRAAGCSLCSAGFKLAQGICPSCAHQGGGIMGNHFLQGKIGKRKRLCRSCSANPGPAGCSSLISDSPWGSIPSPGYCRGCKWPSQGDRHRASVCPSGTLIPPQPVVV